MRTADVWRGSQNSPGGCFPDEGLYLFAGTDRTARFAVAQLVATADRKTAWQVLRHMPEAVPYQVHTILTDTGIQFAGQPRTRNTICSRPTRFGMTCEANGIEHRLTTPNHPWSHEDQTTIRGIIFPNGGQVERMTRTIQARTIQARTIQEGEADQKMIRGNIFPPNAKRFQYEDHDQPRTHLADALLRRGQQSTGLSAAPASPATSPEG